MEQNFTRIPNEYLDNLTKENIPQHCWRCLIFILRKTWGWNRKSAEIRNKEIVENTGLQKQHVNRSIRWLEKRHFINVTTIDYKQAKTYRINFEYELLKLVDEKSSQEVTQVTSTDYHINRYGLQNVASTGYSNPSNPTAGVTSHEPKENKEIIKKNKESCAKAKKEFNNYSFLSSLPSKRTDDEEKKQLAELLRKLKESLKANIATNNHI